MRTHALTSKSGHLYGDSQRTKKSLCQESPLYNCDMETSKPIDELLVNLKDILPMLRQEYHVRTLEVFGSFVRGEAREDSDLDLLVTFEEAPTLFKFVEIENYLSDNLGVKVDLVMKDSLKPAIGKRILKEARPI